ncbi:Metallo-dependent phosphatase-like protein [Dendryphion nanum]|uniref:Metallo-dependent phosphatase-like protein n=1 Tax=Dendryphion nanum TaxID=256645 RepID=A0A9P9IH98_9PLEO|nr:Metallo-dependent phosphatase-like protein [Dendryphion nanum]
MATNTSITNHKRSRSPSPPTDYRQKKIHLTSSPCSPLNKVSTDHFVTVPTTTPTTFLILSDTHSHALPTQRYPSCSVLLHAGDLTEHGTISELRSAIDTLASIPAELRIVIPGNHDISLDAPFYTSQGGSITDVELAHDLCYGLKSYAAQKGITFLAQGTHTFTLPSTNATFTLYASPCTPKYGISAFQYPTSHDIFNSPSDAITPTWGTNTSTPTSRIPESVDIVMTHGPPKYILDSTPDGSAVGCEHLRRAIGRVRPKLLVCGHVHTGWGARRIAYKSTTSSTSTSTSSQAYTDPLLPHAQEFIGANQVKRKGFAALAPGHSEAWRNSWALGREGKGETLCVNAAVLGDEEEGEVAIRAPWVVEIDLRVRKGEDGE